MDRRRIVSLYLRNRRDCQFGLSRRISGKNPRLFLSSLTQPISFSVTFSDYVISINFSPIDRSKHRRTPAKSVVSRKRYLLSLYYNGNLSLFPRRDITRIVRIKRKIVERNIDRLGGNNAIFSESRIETVE